MPIPYLSVIIPCRNEENFVRGLLDSVLQNGYPVENMEILVVDGMSGDRTRQIVQEYAETYSQVKLLENPKRAQAAALNLGISLALGEVLMRLDAHSRYEPGYISALISALRESGADNVGGTWHLEPRSASLFAQACCAAISSRLGSGDAEYKISSGNLTPRWVDTVPYFCAQRGLFDRVGVFNEEVGPSEDMEFSMRLRRAGGRSLLVPTAHCHYYLRTQPWEFLCHNWRNGVWAVLPIARSSVFPFRLRHLAPAAFVGTVLLLMLLTILWPVLGWSLGALLLTYFGAVCGFSLKIALERQKPALMLALPAAYFSLHFAYGLGSLWALPRLVFELSRALLRRTRASSSPGSLTTA
jgi:glycosyltransferase involved in cell wall biosynthesis